MVCRNFCVIVLTGCQNPTAHAPEPGHAPAENTHSFPGIETQTFTFIYGPRPLVPGDASDDYFQRFLNVFRLRLRAAFFNEDFKPNSAGELRLQFHLNSNGSVTDLILLTNTLDIKAEMACKLALWAGPYETWPDKLRKRQFAGYFIVRNLIVSDFATNFSPDFESSLRLSKLTGVYPPNLISYALAHFDTDPEYLNAGFSQMRKKDYADAASSFKDAIQWDPGDAWACGGLGICLVAQKHFDAATTNLSRAIALDPQNASSWNGLALVKIHFKDYTEVVSDASKAIALDPEFPQAYRERAYARKRLQDFTGALEDAEQSVRLAPTNASAFYTRSEIRYCLGDYENALSDCNTAIGLHARYADAYVLRGDVEQAQQSSSVALASFQEALDIDPTLHYPRFKIWILRCKAGDRDRATKELKEHFNSLPQKQSTEWAYQVEAFLTGTLSEADFLNAARTSAKSPQERMDQLCEANYYAGVKRLLDGDKKAAAGFFQNSIATGVGDFGEYINARDELKALQSVMSASK